MSKLKGRKWTKKQKAKAAATRAANKGLVPHGVAPPLPIENRVKDSISYLTSALIAQDRDYSRCLIRLALHTLKGTV